jgi:hypothetical protein
MGSSTTAIESTNLIRPFPCIEHILSSGGKFHPVLS